MKKILFATILSAMTLVVPGPARAEVAISISIPLPPPIVFGAPPAVIVMPDTDYVYVVPDIDIDLFFWNGWWWRPWEGRWYRSLYYDQGWVYYSYAPRFYFDVDPGWRVYYRDRVWYGHPWHYERIPHQQLHQHWRGWRDTRYWERQRTWGVQNYQPRSYKQRQELRQQRQQQYQQRPDVQRHQQWRQEQHKRTQIQQQRGQQRSQPRIQKQEQRKGSRPVQPEDRGRSVRPQADPGGRDAKQKSRLPEKKGQDEYPAPSGERWR